MLELALDEDAFSAAEAVSGWYASEGQRLPKGQVVLAGNAPLTVADLAPIASLTDTLPEFPDFPARAPVAPNVVEALGRLDAWLDGDAPCNDGEVVLGDEALVTVGELRCVAALAPVHALPSV